MPLQQLLANGGFAAASFIRARLPFAFTPLISPKQSWQHAHVLRLVAGPALQGWGAAECAKTWWEALLARVWLASKKKAKKQQPKGTTKQANPEQLISMLPSFLYELGTAGKGCRLANKSCLHATPKKHRNAMDRGLLAAGMCFLPH